MYKADAQVLVRCVLVRALERLQESAQMVAVLRDKTQAAVDVDGGPLADGGPGRTEDRVGDLEFGHGAVADGQGICRLQFHLQSLRIGFPQQALRGLDTPLDVVAGALEYLFARNAADRFTVDHDVQHIVDAQARLHKAEKPHGGRHRQKVGQRVEYDREI